MSFQQGLSGLNAASSSLEAIGNNVANASTAGFKSGQTQFADVYANSLNGSGSAQNGIGTKATGVVQQFSQGNITATSNALDIAINGGGFFRLSDNGAIVYSRNGEFELDKSGYIVNSNGSRLTGYVVNADGVLSTGAPAEIFINTADLAPQITTEVNAVINLDSRQNAPTVSPFDSANPKTYNNATSISVFDSLGNPHVVQTFYVKTAAGTWDVYASVDDAAIGAADVAPATFAGSVAAAGAPGSFAAIAADTFSVNGISIGAIAAGTDAATQGDSVADAINLAMTAAGVTTISAAADATTGLVTITNSAAGGDVVLNINGTANDAAAALAARAALAAATGFSGAQLGSQAVGAAIQGTLTFGNGGALANTDPLSIPLTVGTGAISPFTIAIDYSGTTQYGSTFSVNTLDQNGYASGRLSGFSTSADGTIVGTYTNGQSATLGQVVLASFGNPNGLQPLGNNVWMETATSGAALIGTPASGNLGVLQSSALEDSNVDLTAELVNMITAQRFYQANAQSIKTQDQILQTLVNLR